MSSLSFIMPQMFTLGALKSRCSYCIVLDEIDWLASKENEVLYRIFEWPWLAEARVTVIGIANALDLTGVKNLMG